MVSSIPISSTKLWNNHRYDNPLTLLVAQLRIKEFNIEQVQRLFRIFIKAGYTLYIMEEIDLKNISEKYYNAYEQAYKEVEKLKNQNDDSFHYSSTTP